MDRFNGKRIKEMREKRNLSQEELAELCGISAGSTVSRWENGSLHPSQANIEKIAKALQIEITDLYDDTGQKLEMSLLEREIVGLLKSLNEDEQKFVLDFILDFVKYLH